ncbi:hypothetical protein PMI07_002392 [Rhizobium sp. CF080]|uniref:hypothetical protein n=1 Tax=Rhizobium sp. (strain CF080) TaxID=1144310 RepID=UPI000271C61D|nr:hypothetical protein [Rhizobium sp. CF080]EUB95904.1 hypothetical protein PMI07_002392 [Rhizobium sp. CF080]
MANTKAITSTATTEPALSRRQMLTGFAATSASVAVLAAPSPAKSATAAALPAENPDLLQAHAQLLAARAEYAEAEAALEWLADEWKHLWPLAPEDLLEGAHAESRYATRDNAERDIIGRLLMRDTSVLTKRLNRRQREAIRVTCFHLTTAEQAKERLADWENHTPTGRTEKSLARNQAFRTEMIQKYRERLVLAQAYEAETSRLRKVSGVNAAKERISDAKTKIDRAASKISRVPAFTPAGLAIKAKILTASPVFALEIKSNGFLGDTARLIQAVIDMAGRA